MTLKGTIPIGKDLPQIQNPRHIELIELGTHEIEDRFASLKILEERHLALPRFFIVTRSPLSQNGMSYLCTRALLQIEMNSSLNKDVEE